jgi:tubulin polyglutamylase TTLL1
VRAAFGAEGASVRFKDDQLINHFPNHYELVRKDLMYKNLKRYIRDQAGGVLGSSNSTTNQSSSHFSAGVLSVANPHTGLRLIDCVPVTYSLPADFPLFVEEHKRLASGSGAQPTWIVKPTNRSQGRGIFLIHRTSQITQWLRERSDEDDNSPFIVSRDVARPYLIANRKFDLRLYVLVMSFKPLVAYWHEKGFARFCGVSYSEPKFGDGDEELGAHLTNVALQKREEGYNASHGGKWAFEQLWLYIASIEGSEKAASVLSDIHFLIVHSLRAVQTAILNDKHCFELYGYDILLDDDLRPHLIEINSSPSLTVTTTSDRHVKQEVLLDTFRLVSPVGCSGTGDAVPFAEYRRQPQLQAPHKGGFHLLSCQ